MRVRRRSKVAGDQESPAQRGRRALMLGAAAAGAGAAAVLAGGGEPASAATGSPVELGETNSATATTVITTSSGSGLRGITTDDTSPGGVYGIDSSQATGTFGVQGASKYGVGVYGFSSYSYGLQAYASQDHGVYSETFGNGASAVYGSDESSGGGYGVNGISNAGTGVFGSSTVAGSAGVGASSTNGYGVYTESGSGLGMALAVNGTAAFFNSGTAVVAGTPSAPANSVTVSSPLVQASSMVLVTAQGYVAGVGVAGVVLDASAQSFTIYLTKAIKTSLTLAWFIIQNWNETVGDTRPLPLRPRPR
jgi:hypothetical protein